MNASGAYIHQPVLLDEALAALAIKSEGAYVDGTFGRGGHSAGILARLGVGGQVIAMDKDPEAVLAAHARFKAERRFHIEQGSFANLRHATDRLSFTGRIDGILLDLGLSSPQVDDPKRGFSFIHEGPLDMRMDSEHGPTAAVWLAQAGEAEIAEVLKTYGEERFARRIARAIVAARRVQPIDTTAQLAAIVASAAPVRERHKHPATRSFQAIRIFINRELEDLRDALAQSVTILAAYGRLVVISFHSLEDRIVKRFMRRYSGGEPRARRLPPGPEPDAPLLRRLGKAIRPSESEYGRNPRARSAVLRVAERLP